MTHETTAIAKPTNGHADKIELALIAGDLAKLTPEERVAYYHRVCESIGINPLTRPFEYIVLNGRLTLYARKDATEQLRKIYQVSVTIKSREVVEDVYVVTANAKLPTGREDESIGAVTIQGLKGDARANALMKAETKAKRRVTMSICGLGMLDETEVETIPDAVTWENSPEANDRTPQEKAAIRAANPPPPRKVYCNQEQQDAIRDLGDECGLTNPEKVDLIRPYGVKRATYLTPDQAEAMILDLSRRRVAQLLDELKVNLDDVRKEVPALVGDEPSELNQADCAAALAALKRFKETTALPSF
jgi:hypothetical protein